MHKEMNYLDRNEFNFEPSPEVVAAIKDFDLKKLCFYTRIYDEGKKSIFAYEGTDILVQKDKEVQMAVNSFGNGRSVYISGLPYSFENSRVLYRAILWAAHGEEILNKWFSTNYNVEVHAFVANGKYCVVNNTYVPQDTVVYTDNGSFELHLDANEIRWYSI